MTKENFINKWASVYNVNDKTNPYFVADLEAVIATEIAKVQEVKPKPEYICYKCENKTNNKFAICDKCNIGWNEPKQETLEPTEQPEPNPIEQAYERGEKIRKKHWASEDWIKKISETESIDENGKIWITSNDFKSIKTMPDNWELYPEPAEQPAKPFDKERFEAMFRAVIETHEATMNSLKQLDAYYATKNN